MPYALFESFDTIHLLAVWANIDCFQFGIGPLPEGGTMLTPYLPAFRASLHVTTRSFAHVTSHVMLSFRQFPNSDNWEELSSVLLSFA